MTHYARSIAHVLAIACLVGLLTPSHSAARSPDIPAALEPWKDWVLHDAVDRQCPGHFNDNEQRRCWWPTRMAVDAGDHGSLFDMQVVVYAPTWVTLPGSEASWPESVVTGSDALPVVARDGRPAVWLEPGDYRIKGAFVWDTLPEVLWLPRATGILSVSIGNREIADPDIDAEGRLRLNGSGGEARSEDSMTATIFRLIEDDIPMRVTTHALIQVSGRPREIRLAALLHKSATVMRIDSLLPVRLGDSGDLLLQARPGRWDIQVTERLDGPVERLSMEKGLYGAEIWSFKAFNHLRMVRLSGAPAIEPSQTQMPDGWKGYPAYRLESGSTLVFDVLRRGDPDPAADQLTLSRTWWLDFDGSGFTIHDRVSGTLNRTWHLAMEPPGELGRVTVNGQDQLITRQGDRGAPGVQLRRGRLSLEADSRLARQSTALPAVGWDHDFQHVSGVLHLPPGWTLFSAIGADVPPGAWLQRWSLLDFFLVLIIAVSTYKIRNRNAGLLALATLLLTFHEPGAPRYVWLHLLAVAALLRHLPDGWFKTVVKWWGAGSVIALITIAIPFAVQQVRCAIYPQLAPHGHAVRYRPATQAAPQSDEERIAGSSLAPMAEKTRRHEMKPMPSPEPMSLARPSRFSTDPDALVQTGPGLPAWQWQALPLHWNGPVDRTQQLRLWLISPTLNRLLGLVRTGLLFGLIVVFLDLRNWRRHLPLPSAGKAVVLAMILALSATSPILRADAIGSEFPPQALLDELRRRLIEPPPCLPTCADINRLELAATPDQLRLIMQVHASIDTAVPLPATLETWRPNRIMVDNQPAGSLARDDRGALWMVLPQGVHQVKLTGPTGDVDEIRIAFPILPHIGTYAGVGWQAQGFGPNGVMDSTIVLTRVASGPESAPARARPDVPAFFQVTRTLHLGLQWSTETNIRRLTATGKPAVLSIPLLHQASVTTPGIHVQDGMARVSFDPEATEIQYTAVLPITSKIALSAPGDVPWAETWILDAATIWRCRTDGLTVVHHQDADRNWQPQWRPWPGEQVLIEVTRPEAVAGRIVTVDRARLVVTPGARFSRSTLTLAIRSSKGGQHQLELPESANLQSVTLNGKTLPVRQDGKLVTLPLQPGAQTAALQWLQLTGAMTRIRAPQVNVGQAAVNAEVTFQMPDNRWILLTGGPRLGPAVLFWSYLVVVLLVAAGLGRTTLTPLTTRHWTLLALGLTQVPTAIAIVVVGWLLALGYRNSRTPQRPWAFNGVQLLLALLTLAAFAGLYLAIERGLLGIPDMQIAGNESNRNQLNWTQDRIPGLMPIPWVVSLPQWIYHLLMLAWSLWLAFNLVAWLRWGWTSYSTGGLWRPMQWRRKGKSTVAGTSETTREKASATGRVPDGEASGS